MADPTPAMGGQDLQAIPVSDPPPSPPSWERAGHGNPILWAETVAVGQRAAQQQTRGITVRHRT